MGNWCENMKTNEAFCSSHSKLLGVVFFEKTKQIGNVIIKEFHLILSKITLSSFNIKEVAPQTIFESNSKQGISFRPMPL